MEAETVCYNARPKTQFLHLDTNATGSESISLNGNDLTEVFLDYNFPEPTMRNTSQLPLPNSTTFRRQDSILLNVLYLFSDYTKKIVITVLSQINGGTTSNKSNYLVQVKIHSISVSGGTAPGPNITISMAIWNTGKFYQI